MDIERLLATYPRRRPPLAEAYRRIYEREYKLNRSGGTAVHSVAQQLEAWMHRQVRDRGTPGRVLELGAGSLNHLAYEPDQRYDIVEPFTALYRDSPHLPRIGRVYEDIGQIDRNETYDRIVSIAVLEHVERLPELLAKSGVLLSESGVFQAAIPSEGGFLWGAAWRASTGLTYRLRNGLPYGPLMRYEHINSAREIAALVGHFFERVEVRRFPLPWLHGSLYTYLHASGSRLAACHLQLGRADGAVGLDRASRAGYDSGSR